MTLTHPITVSSWTLGDQCKFEDRVKAAAKAGSRFRSFWASNSVWRFSAAGYPDGKPALLP